MQGGIQTNQKIVYNKNNNMPKQKVEWKEISRETAFEKYGRGVERVIFKLPDGKEVDFYIKKEGPAVCVLPITKNKEIVLVKQFRPGPKKTFFELPGGFLNKNEDPIECASRELLEETGYRGKIELITDCYDDAYSSMHRYCLVAKDCEKVSKQKLESAEFAEIKLMNLEEFRKLLRSGQMTDIEVGYLALDYLKLL